MGIVSSNFDRINGSSKVPKYRQVIQTILSDIQQEVFKPGERIPSINETSEEYYLSRDTVEKAYKELSRRGIITSVPGKGYYVTVKAVAQIKIMVVFNKLSDYKKQIYNAFVKRLGKRALVNFYVHSYDSSFFESLVLDGLGHFDHYVIMPHFYQELPKAMSVIQKIPRNKLIILDKELTGLDGNFGCIYQHFEEDIFNGMTSGLDLFEKYNQIRLVFPQKTRYPAEIVTGFERFCQTHAFRYDTLPDLNEATLTKGQAYVVIEECELINLIKMCNQANLRIGKDIGILSYNDTPFKEVLASGISVITTDHAKMGEMAAEMIMENNRYAYRNPFKLIRRNSL